ncbi:MAG: (d)CMP kinase [Gammaproteobacteria bacterium]
MTVPVVTIDGPSGTGKGTISRMLADSLGWHMLDSGALYRLVALGAQRHGYALDDEATLADYARQLDVQFLTDPASGEPLVRLENTDVTDAIRTETAGNNASRVAALPLVREALLERQRAFCTPPGLVADGRDMGTTIFPAAPLKIYLTASAEIRAERRHKQLKDKGISVSLPALVKEIAERDARDSQRSVSPLKPAPDAVVIDTTDMGIEAVFKRVELLCQERLESTRV